MRYKFLITILLSGIFLGSKGQQIKFTEYDLDNGLHVILHQDNTAPVVAVSVMYHVGSKDENPSRTGFAHFFEHLLFEGSENMKRGDFMNIVSSNGGENNASTSQDRTFYYEVFPSNQLELGLWLESERMLHPKIDELGVKTQNEVVKEEKRLRMDNNPYGKFTENIFTHLFQGHPYRWQVIGSMAHLDAAKLDEFIAFFKKYYAPNNAVLTIAGDLDIEKTKTMVAKYFNEIPKGTPVVKGLFELKPVTKQIVDTVYDANIQIPAIFAAYRIPGMKSRDSKVLEMVSTLLSGGGSSRLKMKMVDDKKTALEVAAFNYDLEDYGAYITFALPNNNTSLNDLLIDIDAEIVRLQSDLISESEFKKLQNQMENGYVSANTKMVSVAENLANGYILQDKNTNDLNEQLAHIKSITREEIRDVAKKYLNKDQRVVLYYLPTK
ncbi:putative Zn-dependent peptidase [Pedobacter cryoconitis]|uniref:M16 family metallopeptidase n=1 Tax=Pedobacter cryoconitis TaxID=188932 RepID=UPI0016076DDE|nr:pitrilysin family protein [Pedobacter cryoconitis]MBB6271876.1 putative Zn-dependent peptidase [Pedobacter cryoconitis]